MDDQYNKPPLTFTESLSKEEIKKLLEDYDQITSIDELEKGIHVRYFSKQEDDKYKFRMGGIIIIIKDEYVIMSNGKKKWSVQINDTIFFKKKSLSKIKDDHKKEIMRYEKIIDNQNKKIEELEKKIQQQKLEYLLLKKQIDK